MSGPPGGWVPAPETGRRGLFPDWIEDLRKVAGPQVVADMANGAEAYLQMWARADTAKTR